MSTRVGALRCSANAAFTRTDPLVRSNDQSADLPLVDSYLAREAARRGDHDAATTRLRAAVDQLARGGQLLAWGVLATTVLVETLLDHGGDGLAEAEAATELLAAEPVDEDSVFRDIVLIGLRALLARARGDAAAYTDFRDRYRDMAKTLGFEGHIAWADAML
jgi:hypothetical protein